MQTPTVLAHAALFGWIPVVLLLFVILPRRRAVITAFLMGWLFLPVMGYPIEGLPDFDKMAATNGGALLGLLLIDRGRAFLAFRPHWLDLPMLIWCLCPVASSLANGLGVYDGLSSAFDQTMAWGLPYVIGRATFTSVEDLKELAVGLVIAGIAYAPLCLYEIRMSPQLHNVFYGYYQHSFMQTKRMGGFRPMVFMDHGLMVATFMTFAALMAGWLWYSGVRRHLFGVSLGIIAVCLIVIAVLCKSAMAIGLLVLGIGTLWLLRQTGWRVVLMLLLAIAPAYLFGRATGVLSKPFLIDVAGTVAGEARAQSLEFRLNEETPLYERAMQRPVFGWGGWNRSRRIDPDEDPRGQRMQVTDSLWIVALGRNGYVGLVSVMGTLLLIPTLLFWLLPRRQLVEPPGAVATGVTLLVVLFAVDSLLNAMLNPIYLIALGGAGTLVQQRVRGLASHSSRSRAYRRSVVSHKRPAYETGSV